MSFLRSGGKWFGGGGGFWTPAAGVVDPAVTLGSALVGDFNPGSLAAFSLSGTDVVQWTDPKSGAVFTPPGTAPTYSATGFNGRPCVVFDGVEAELICELGVPTGWPIGANAAEIWAALDITGTAAGSRIAFSWGALSGGSAMAILGKSGASGSPRVRAGTLATAVSGSTDFSGRHVAASFLAAGGGTVGGWQDGAALGSSASTTSLTNETAAVGSYNGGLFLEGKIARLIVVNRVTTSGERAALQAYFNSLL